jgi:hypothetical protein
MCFAIYSLPAIQCFRFAHADCNGRQETLHVMRGALFQSFYSEGDHYSGRSPVRLTPIPSLRQSGNPGTAFPVLRHQSYKPTSKCRLALGA